MHIVAQVWGHTRWRARRKVGRFQSAREPRRWRSCECEVLVKILALGLDFVGLGIV